MNASTIVIATPESIARVRTLILSRSKTCTTAMHEARKTMSDQVLAMGAASALTSLQTEFDSMPKDKREASGLKLAIRGVYKDMSTAVSHERAALKKEFNDEATETAKLHARFPWRIKAMKGCYVVLSHAEFDAETANRRTRADDGKGDDGAEGDNGESGESAKGIDKAAAAIAALEIALAAMTADRDAWKTRALLAESTAADARKPIGKTAKPAKPAKAAKAPKAAKAG